MKIVRISDLVWNNPPFPFVEWTESSIARFLQRKGFDLQKPIIRTRRNGEDQWEQI